MNPTQEQLNARILSTGIQPAPQVPTTINAGSLGQTQGLSVAPTVQVPTPTLPILDTPGQLSSFENQVNTAGKKDVALNDAISTATSPFQQQLSDVNSQIGALNARAIQNQERAMQTGETLGFATREAQNIARTDAIQGLFLKSQADALQGNIASAESTATRAVNAQFAQKEQDILSARQNIVNNYDSFTSAEKKRANATLLRLDKDDAFVAQEKETAKTIQGIAIKAAENGADASTLLSIQKSGKPEEAIRLASEFLGAKFKQEAEQQAFDNRIKTRQLTLLEDAAVIATKKNLIELAKLGDASAIKGLGYDPREIPLTSEKILNLESQIGSLDKDKATVDRLLGNTTGLRKSAGLLRGQGFFAGIAGGVLEGRLGLGTLPFDLSKRNDFLADAKSIITNQTFTRFKELADQGIKLTPISNAEIKLIGDSAGVLSSSARYDDAGNLTGFAMSEGKVTEELGKISQSMQRLKLDVQGQLHLPPEDRKEIINTK